MIWQILLDSVYQIITGLLSFINIPSLPAVDDLNRILSQFITDGAGILGFFVSFDLLGSLLGLWLSVYGLKVFYNFVMFILGKLGIK